MIYLLIFIFIFSFMGGAICCKKLSGALITSIGATFLWFLIFKL